MVSEAVGPGGGAQPPDLNLLYITLEFSDPIFSGNGVLSRIFVRALLGLGCHVTVVCGTPSPEVVKMSTGMDHPNLKVYTVPVSTWWRLDRKSAWEEFGENAQAVAEGPLADIRFDAVLGVDWTSTVAVRHLLANRAKALYVFLCFRVFSEKCGPEGEVLENTDFYHSMERTAMAMADGVVGLSSNDIRCLQAIADTQSSAKSGKSPDHVTMTSNHGRPSKFHVVSPALRADMHALALEEIQGPMPQRQYLMCCVRLASEKNPRLFVEVVEHLGPWLREQGVLPCLCGAVADVSLAAEIKARLREAVPESVVVEAFLGPASMADIYRATVLNFHPSLYDAYGMTIVEAAAFGTPSLIHHEGRVGAADLLRAEEGEVCEADLSTAESAAQAVMALLANATELHTVGKRARRKALSYDEKEAGRRVAAIVRSLLRADSC